MSVMGSGMASSSSVGGEAPSASAAIAAEQPDTTTGKGLIHAKRGNPVKPQGAGPSDKGRIVGQELPGMGKGASAGETQAEEPNPLEALLLKEIGEEANPRPDQDELDALKGLEDNPNASERIRGLISKNKEIAAKAKEDHELAYQYYERVQQMEQQFGRFAGQLRNENAMLKARLDALSGQAEEARLRDNPEAQLQNQWLQKQRELIQQELTPYQQEIQRLRQQEQMRQREQKMNKIRSRHSAEMDKALNEVLVSSLPEGHLSDNDMASIKRWAYAVAMDANAKGQPLNIRDSVLQMKRVAAKLSLGLLRHGQKQNAATKQVAGEASTVVRGGNGATRGNPEPDIRTLRFNKFKDLPEWKMSGRPSLRTPPQDYDW